MMLFMIDFWCGGFHGSRAVYMTVEDFEAGSSVVGEMWREMESEGPLPGDARGRTAVVRSVELLEEARP